MAATASPARWAARQCNASSSPRTKRTIARAVRPAARSLPTAHSRGCSRKAGRARWKNWNKGVRPLFGVHMNRRSLLALLSLTAVAPAFAQQRKPAAKQRVVFQVSDNDPAKWNLALNNAKNVLVDLGKENVQIEIVAYGPGMAMLKAEATAAARLADYLDAKLALLRGNR